MTDTHCNHILFISVYSPFVNSGSQFRPGMCVEGRNERGMGGEGEGERERERESYMKYK